MDQITKHKLDQAAQELIDSIEPSKVCQLASSFHPKSRACRIFSEWKKGSYNVCFPVVFDPDADADAESMNGEGEKWMVRIPLLPRLAFPEEKMRSEIATMKYIAEKTTIPIPRLHGYSITSYNILDLPFILMEYVEGRSLFDTVIKDLERDKREHLYSQLSNVYVQLYRQQFPRIGALTLDKNNEHWVFENNRPLTVAVNEQEVSGLDICRHMNPRHTFTSTIDYIFFITKLIFNDFYRGRDSILGEDDARSYLYGIYASQGILMEWVQPEYNHGPFILTHGDLRTPNIIIDDDYNIVSILDWEWSHTVPAQLFAPPFWLTDQDILGISKDIASLGYYMAFRDFFLEVSAQEKSLYRLPLQQLPLTNLWKQHKIESLLIAHGLLKPHYFGNIYYDVLDQRYYGENTDERIEAFFQLKIRQKEYHIVKQKMLEFEEFDKERRELGVEQRMTISYATRTPEEDAELAKKMQRFLDSRDKTNKRKQQLKLKTVFDAFTRLFPALTCHSRISQSTGTPDVGEDIKRTVVVHLRWLIIGASAMTVVYTVGRILKKYAPAG